MAPATQSARVFFAPGSKAKCWGYNGTTPAGATWSADPTVTPPPGSVGGINQSPFNNTPVSETQSYFSVWGPGVNGGAASPVTLDFASGQSDFSMLWGSIDTYNTLEVLGAGGRVLLLIDPEDQYMNLYLPAALAGRLTQGDEARVLLDALPERPLPARIAYVAAKAQFTPKEVETRDERQKLVFRVKLRLTEPAAVPQAKPGMPGVGYVRSAEVAWPAELQ